MIKLDISKTLIAPEDVTAYEGAVASAQQALENATCEGNGFLGWLHLPSQITPEFLEQLQSCANTLREHCDTVVVAGIGGSYLGARAVIEALGNSFQWQVNKCEIPNVLFAGYNIGEDYLYELTEYLKDRKFDLIISNPPYVTEAAMEELPAEYRHEPALALGAGRDGMDILRRMMPVLADYLTDDGMAVIEIGDGREAFEALWPTLPVTWLTTSGGDDMVFLVKRSDLKAYFHQTH